MARSSRSASEYLQNWIGSTPTHYGNSQLLKADVWTNGCGETAAEWAKVTEYVHGIKESAACPGMNSLFRSTDFCFPLSPSVSFCPVELLRKSPSLQGLRFH